MDIDKKILADPLTRWVFKRSQLLNTEVFLVGGYIRDLLRSKPSNDRDFVLRKNVKNIARQAAKKFHGTFIEFKNRDTYRVVIKQRKPFKKTKTLPLPQQILDFSYLKSPIERDLWERDFTVDAIAWSQKTGIVDPCMGRHDIEKKIISAVRLKNLLNDPLRMLRAYRIAAELHFHINRNTSDYIRKYAQSIIKAAPERITEELFKILNERDSFHFIRQCSEDQVLRYVFLTCDSQNRRKLSKNVNFLYTFDTYTKMHLKKKKKTTAERNIANYLKKEISQGLNIHGLMRFSILLRNLSAMNSHVRISRDIHRALKDINTGLAASKNRKYEKNLYKIFIKSGNRVFENTLFLSLEKKVKLLPLLNRANDFLNMRKKRMLNGNEIKTLLQLKQGKNIGKILSEIEEKRFAGKLKNKREAKKWLLGNFT
jgi:tRNA nucleotidyltransferase/poly(A) polymerase